MSLINLIGTAGTTVAKLQGYGTLLSFFSFLDTTINFTSGRMALGGISDIFRGATGLNKEGYHEGKSESGTLAENVGNGFDNLAIMTFAAAGSSMGFIPRAALGAGLMAWQLAQMGTELYGNDGDPLKDRLIDAPGNFLNMITIASTIGLGHTGTLVAKKLRNNRLLKLGNLTTKQQTRLTNQNTNISKIFETTAKSMAESTAGLVKPVLSGLRVGWQV